MPYYSDEKIEEVNEAADIVELISHYVSLKRAGSAYKGLCPFHNEKTPSFVVTPQKRMFHCFGCGVGGGAIRFLMMIAGHSFPEAVEELARRYGVELPENDSASRPSGAAARENKGAVYEVLKAARLWFEENLWSETGAEARRYLGGRGLSPAITREFGLGCAPDAWDGLHRRLSRDGFGETVMIEAGLIKPGRLYDVFRDRLMIPILDAESRVVAFGGRLLGEAANQPKYLNSPETPVYKKGKILYGFNRARPFLRSAGLIFLVEGYFDLIAMVAGGINETAATLGTALTPAHLNLLKGHVREVLLLFDSDEAGQRAAARALPLLLNAELDGRTPQLPAGHDPDTFIREFGAEAIYEAASQAMDIVDFQVARLKSAHPNSMAGQARMAREARELLAQVPDTAKSRLLLKRLARLLDLDESLLGHFSGPPKQLSRPQAAAPDGPVYDQMAGELLKFILIHPEAAPEVLTKMAAYWPADASRALFDRLREDYEQNGRVAAENICRDDSGPLASLLSEAALSERFCAPEESPEIAAAYMRRLMDKWRKKRQTDISAAIKIAQARGDEAKLLELLTEKKSLAHS